MRIAIRFIAALCAVCALAGTVAAETAGRGTLAWRLLGTVRSASGDIALCFDPATGQSFSLKVGQKFAGWQLRAVEEEDAVFVNDSSDRAVIKISSPAGAAALPRPASPPTAPAPAPVQSQRDNGPAAPQPKETWVDGDGQVISPPKR
jgi:hypothetical protein